MRILERCLVNLNIDDDTMLSFWRFVTKEVPTTDQFKDINNTLGRFCSGMHDKMLKNPDKSHNEKFLSILDETLLLQVDIGFK